MIRQEEPRQWLEARRRRRSTSPPARQTGSRQFLFVPQRHQRIHARRAAGGDVTRQKRSEEHTSELQSLTNLVCRLLLEKKKKNKTQDNLKRTYIKNHANK